MTFAINGVSRKRDIGICSQVVPSGKGYWYDQIRLSKQRVVDISSRLSVSPLLAAQERYVRGEGSSAHGVSSQNTRR